MIANISLNKIILLAFLVVSHSFAYRFLGKQKTLSFQEAMGNTPIPQNQKPQISEALNPESLDVTLFQSDDLYFWNLGVGSPKQYFQMLMDTGSSDIWTYLMDCKGQEGCSIHDQSYILDFSRDYQQADLGVSFYINYYSTSIKGSFLKDSVQLKDNLKIDSQLIGSVSNSYRQNISANFDGVIGLGFPDIAIARKVSSLTFLESIFASLNSKKIFCLDLRESPSDASIATFGKIDLKSNYSSPQYFSVAKDGYWQIEIYSITYGDSEADNFCCEKKCGGIIDSGTTFFGVPRDYFNAAKVLSLLEKSNDCNHNDLPTINIRFSKDGNVYKLRPKDYVFPDNNKEDHLECVNIVQPIDTKIGDDQIFILGTFFFMKYYLVFDLEQQRIGISYKYEEDTKDADKEEIGVGDKAENSKREEESSDEESSDNEGTSEVSDDDSQQASTSSSHKKQKGGKNKVADKTKKKDKAIVVTNKDEINDEEWQLVYDGRKKDRE